MNAAPLARCAKESDFDACSLGLAAHRGVLSRLHSAAMETLASWRCLVRRSSYAHLSARGCSPLEQKSRRRKLWRERWNVRPREHRLRVRIGWAWGRRRQMKAHLSLGGGTDSRVWRRIQSYGEGSSLFALRCSPVCLSGRTAHLIGRGGGSCDCGRCGGGRRGSPGRDGPDPGNLRRSARARNESRRRSLFSGHRPGSTPPYTFFAFTFLDEPYFSAGSSSRVGTDSGYAFQILHIGKARIRV